MCLSCARMVFETDFSTSAWYCTDCIDKPAAMPLTNHLGREQYDTRRVFAGLKTRWIAQGDSRLQREQEVVCRLGVMFACGENCVGFTSNATRTANKILEKFPEVRCFARSDDGNVTLHIPMESFEHVAVAVGVRKKKVLSEEHKAKLRANAALARGARMAR